ncbi:alkaline phosphatase family protein [candidate division WOR-3 bacterium]|nr:alkaline phosphatase family protein [candidate division WOR-3 bacterium]
MFGYVNIGAGLPFISSVGAIIGLILTFLVTFFIFLKRKFLLMWNRKVFKLLLIICGLLIIGFLGGIMIKKIPSSKSQIPKVIILGMDGLEPSLIKKFMDEGRLPNFSMLKENGSYRHLKTICPPQSPVVWTSIFTGLTPGHHGIFDFVVRDPKDYSLDLALTKITPKGITLTRKGTPFWMYTSKKKIPTVMLHVPVTFPPDKVYGKMLSGMGVTDIRGTEGIYSFYTTSTIAEKEPRGKIFYLPNIEIVETVLPGPIDMATKREITIPLKITKRDSNTLIEFQNQQIELKEKEWSPWCKVIFSISPLKKVCGICRFYLKEISPDFKLYCSPINFDPERPPFPISYPKGYSKELVKELGLYYTQGEPYDTKALSDGVISEQVFLEHANFILKENENLLFKELNQFDRGILFFYFEHPDIIQHMFWRFIDPDRNEPDKDLYKDVIPECYEKMDEILGKVMMMLDENTTLMVLSDHGFAPFRRTVNINTWLLKNGFLYLKDNKKVGQEFFEDIDWKRTEAYSFGFGGIYINIKGREGEGIVDASDVLECKSLLLQGLENLADPKNGMKVVNKVYTKEEVFQGPYSNNAPDLYVGFNRGYRISWKCALGGVEENIVEDNKSKWSGDHIIDPELVPGILFMNKKTEVEKPCMLDIAPTILKIMGIQVPEDMTGKPLLE